ncbi:Dynamin family protein [Tindallia magadiensis]|uniref:Dynamin family protein n=1 Tax=Tindallia magadiensis TaxID=69895 RepID=A0A1I3G4N4_9FIRM|nr:dynamin family protein [Tindallia magadiensis]SFI18439.1 Dynamin family protein [Tindallia magadiensis]
MENRELINKLNEAEAVLREMDFLQNHRSAIQQLQAKQQNKELNISVVGQFKRGKSSFINAVLKEPLLPVGIVPITSVVTKIKYGSEGAYVHFDNGNMEKISSDKLVHYISEVNNPENQKKVDSVTIQTKQNALKPGTTIVDTPGVGSTHKHNTSVAYSFLKESDAVIFMLSVDSPINEIEETFLREAKKSVLQFYFAINKIDTVSEEELEQYLAYCAKKLKEIMEKDNVEIYPVSAKKHIGIDHIMTAIDKDLRDQGDRILMESTTIKLEEVVKDALSRIQLYIKAVELPLEKLEDKKKQLNKMLKRLDELQKMADLRMEQQTETLICHIEAELQSHRNKAEEVLSRRLDEKFQENQAEKPRQMEKVLLSHLEKGLTDHLETMNETGIEQLTEGYDAMTTQLHEELTVISEFASEIVKELFAVEITHHFISQQVSEKSDYYVSVKVPKASFIIDMNKLVYLLPRSKGNQLILEKARNLLQDDLERNQNNMVYNCRYKLKESLRSFRGQLQKETENMKDDLLQMMERIERDRNRTSDEVDQTLQFINKQMKRLEGVRAEN